MVTHWMNLLQGFFQGLHKEPDGVFPSVRFWIYLICMVVYMSAGEGHFCTAVSSSGRIDLWSWNAALRRLLLRSMWRESVTEYPAHCVSTRQMFYCLTDKPPLTVSRFLWRFPFIMMLFVWRRPLSGAVKSSGMTLVEGLQSVVRRETFRDLRSSSYWENDLCGCDDTQTAEQEIWSRERWDGDVIWNEL